ncbi:MAG: YitT family protein [Firmicutes bacterium]|nr:YitT family protein [Bacillota bacterium]
MSLREIKKNKYARLFGSICLIVFSALAQSFIMQVFMNPCNLLSGGFTGISLLINKILALRGINFPVSVGILLLNAPAAFFCAKHISKRFTLLSALQFFLVSVFLEAFKFEPFFDDIILNILFGGILWGTSISLALKAGGSTGGTDFIAQYVSIKIHKGIWEYVFAFNCCMLIIFGYIFGWIYAGYSIVFQFLSTKMISTLYQRFSQITLDVMTKDPEAVSQAFFKACRHGMTVFIGYGAYSHTEMFLCKAVISSYQVEEAIYSIRKADPSALINTYQTINFYGNFHVDPIE